MPDVRVGPDDLYSVADVVEDPHFLARENITSVQDEELAGALRMANVIGKLSATPGAVERAGPRLGASNREILIDELAFSEEQLSEGGLVV